MTNLTGWEWSILKGLTDHAKLIKKRGIGLTSAGNVYDIPYALLGAEYGERLINTDIPLADKEKLKEKPGQDKEKRNINIQEPAVFTRFHIVFSLKN